VRAWRRAGSDPATRRAAEDRGRAAEARAVLWLRLKGYRVLGRRLRTPVGEIDLMVRRGDLVCFVEVKARARLEDALSATSDTQRRRIERAASYLIANRPNLRGKDLRFDILAIAPGRRPRHVVDAWRPSAELF
jgi:putative endonuclease